MILKNVLFAISKFLPVKIAYAHCDVPCGIYDPKAAQIAATTVLKMVQLIQDLPRTTTPRSSGRANAPTVRSWMRGLPKETPTVNDRNKFVRCVLTKEEHAGKCKEELLILWTDYFKLEHLVQFPNLHEVFWKAAKLCSKNKQEVNLQSAQELVKAVDEIAQIFQKAKNATLKK